MRCAISFLSVIVLVVGVGVAAFFIIWTTDEDYLRATEHTNFTCPKGFTKCDENETLCIPNYKKCDNVYDCPNGSDEKTMDCRDMNDSTDWIYRALSQCEIRKSPARKSSSRSMGQPALPFGCNRTDNAIFCNNTMLNPIPWKEIDTSVATLTLDNVLDVEFLELELVPPKNNSIKRVYIHNNNIPEIGESSFCNWNMACWMSLDSNNITKIQWNSFCEMSNLSLLSMSRNSLTLEGFYFERMSQLRDLFLDHNQIATISSVMFTSLVNLRTLNLKENHIIYIHEDAFLKNIELEELYLTNNKLKQLLPNLFLNQKNMQRLYLDGNPIQGIPGKVFASLESLGSLNVEGIPLEVKDLVGLLKLKKLDYVKFKKFSYCKYVPAASRCYPPSDSITTVMNLLAGTSVRYIVWIVATLTLIGNLVVLFSRECCGKQGRILDVFVKNLAGADFLMGVYLIILAVKDLEYRNSYNIYAYQWGTSYLCSFIGVLAMISSEVSLLILTIISVERCLVICFSYNPESKMLSLNLARFSMGIIWIFVTILAVAPAIQWRGKLSFYGSTGLCFPIHLDDPYTVGWQYTSFVIVGVNTTCLVIVGFCYSTLFYAVRKTTKRAARIVPNKDMEMALKCFLMIFTDCLCWLPIIVLKIYTLSGNHIRKELITWVVIFVLPINSAINPFLYTFSMPKTRTIIVRRFHQFSAGRLSRNFISLRLRHPRTENVEPDESSRDNSWDTSNITNTTSGEASQNNSNSRVKNRLAYQESTASSNFSFGRS